MDGVKVIEIKKSVFDANDMDASALRKELKAKKVFLLNVMSSPGAGKTTTLIGLINDLKKDYRISFLVPGSAEAREMRAKRKTFNKERRKWKNDSPHTGNSIPDIRDL